MDNIQARHSSYTNAYPSVSVDTRTFSKSDMNMSKPHCSSKLNESDIFRVKNSCEEYYKRYEYDERPVKENSSIDNSYKEDRMSGDTKDSIANSELDNLELKVLKNISHEFQSDDTSIESLESNIKLFKCTVQEIFDKFYNSMNDYELYKQRYRDILSKKNDSILEMESFIKNMIQNILSISETSIDNIKTKSNVGSLPQGSTAVETYKNENYSSESADDSKCRNKKEETLNIYLLSVAPYVAIKMNNRNQLSEIDIRDSSIDELEGQLASAENIKMIAAKKRQLERYITQHNVQPNDRSIPIKVSCPKKDISLNEDFAKDKQEESMSLISKICNYICKRFRKASF
ncbi:uncharacterized protein LOC110993686 [Pieris rapae]|uniref:uncharacterized protein LOC110993686 n=1 Tax=Pieris rapae TaxID=64459 RepID=UPI001E27FB96|nr:uncharacterized protein LOC110993686 [Pieris rapae]